VLLQALGKGMMAKTPPKSVLLDQARSGDNRAAIGLLKMEQQLGLMRYHGIANYTKTYLLPQSFQQGATLAASTTTTDSTTETSTTSTNTLAAETTTPAPSPQKAKIAFMITSAMRSELQQSLGYTADDIKSMTPLQASLVLNHAITPDQRAEALPKAMQQHEEEAERQRAAAQMEAEKEAQNNAPQSSIETSDQQSPTLLIGSSLPSKESGDAVAAAEMAAVPDNDAPAVKNDDEDIATKERTFNDSAMMAGLDKEWLELVEIAEDTKEATRIGLYSEQAEAELGLETRQFIADRDDRKSTYEIRKVPKVDF